MMNPNFKIGLYVRVSTEEQAENPEGSIKNQEERLKEFVRLKQVLAPFGEVVDTFIDAGISAKDMNRPALQRLLSQIQRKEINLVLVTELSRFTRSIKDFSVLWEFLEKHQCKFMSIKDNFDTSTAAGEMVMYMMATIAQFERKQTAERISHSFLARAKRGLYNGGSLPLGYEIDKAKPGGLAIIPEEAELVRLVFKTFLEETTLASAAKKLNEYGMTLPSSTFGRGKAGAIRIDFVHKLLRNKAYIGVRVFNTKDGKQEEVKAAWDPIINLETYDKAERLLVQNRFRKRSYLNLRYPFTLSGVTFCQCCGDRMSGKSAHGRSGKIPYYEHARAAKHQAALKEKQRQCDPYRIPAKKIEPVVWNEVKLFLLDGEKAKQFLELAKTANPKDEIKSEKDNLKKKIKSTHVQMENLVDRISRLPKGVDESLFLKQLNKLQETKKALETRLEGLTEVKITDEMIPYEDFIKFTAKLRSLITAAETDLELRSEIIRTMVQRIEVKPKGVDIEFYIGKHRMTRELGDKIPGSQPVNKASRPLPKFLKGVGSKTLTIGGCGLLPSNCLKLNDSLHKVHQPAHQLYPVKIYSTIEIPSITNV